MEEDDNVGDEPPHKKRKLNGKEMDSLLNVMDRDECNELPSCVGLGIIRSINAKKRMFYLITPVPPIRLNKVNVFMRGSTVLPPQFLFDSHILTTPPYWNGASI